MITQQYYRNKDGTRTIETLRWDAYYGNNLMCKIRSRTHRQTDRHTFWDSSSTWSWEHNKSPEPNQILGKWGGILSKVTQKSTKINEILTKSTKSTKTCCVDSGRVLPIPGVEIIMFRINFIFYFFPGSYTVISIWNCLIPT